MRTLAYYIALAMIAVAAVANAAQIIYLLVLLTEWHFITGSVVSANIIGGIGYFILRGLLRDDRSGQE